MKRFPILPGVAVLAIALLAPSSARPQDRKGGDRKGAEKKDPPRGGRQEAQAGADLEAWGVLKEVKGTPFYTLDYTKTEGRKAAKHSAFIKPGEDVVYLKDRMVPITDLKEGDEVWLLGRPVEREAQDPTGNLGMDRQIQNVAAIAAGSDLRVQRGYRDPRDPKVLWCQAVIEKAGAAISVKYEGNTYRVMLAKAAPVLRRETLEAAQAAKSLKSGIQAQVSGEKLEERPETKSPADAKKGSFLAKKLVFLDPRMIRSVYPMLLE